MEDITVAELKQRIKNGESPNLIDVREKYEHEEFNIGGMLIPLGDLMSRTEDIEHMKDSEIVLYCRSGNRSGMAKQLLLANGYSGARNLLGGMLEWVEVE